MVIPAVLTKKEVIIMIGLSNTTLFRMEREGKFPKKIQLGAKRVGWRYSVIMEWLESRPNV